MSLIAEEIKTNTGNYLLLPIECWNYVHVVKHEKKHILFMYIFSIEDIFFYISAASQAVND